MGVKHDVSGMCLRYILSEAWGSESVYRSEVIGSRKLDG
jgi:hypothetical protein